MVRSKLKPEYVNTDEKDYRERERLHNKKVKHFRVNLGIFFIGYVMVMFSTIQLESMNYAVYSIGLSIMCLGILNSIICANDIMISKSRNMLIDEIREERNK